MHGADCFLWPVQNACAACMRSILRRPRCDTYSCTTTGNMGRSHDMRAMQPINHQDEFGRLVGFDAWAAAYLYSIFAQFFWGGGKFFG